MFGITVASEGMLRPGQCGEKREDHKGGEVAAGAVTCQSWLRGRSRQLCPGGSQKDTVGGGMW